MINSFHVFKQRAIMKETKKPRTLKALIWKGLNSSDFKRLEKGFIHFTGKTVHSSVNSVGIRLKNNVPMDDIPYIGLSTLGATHKELDYTEGGASFIPKPRQVKDYITQSSSGEPWDYAALTQHERDYLLDESGGFVGAINQLSCDLPNCVPTLLKQIIVPYQGKDVSLSPIGAIGLSSLLLKRLNEEKGRRASIENIPVKNYKKFWGTASNGLGGKKPQNIGLICAVVGGPEVAGFAWHFRVPSFPVHHVQKEMSTLFKRFAFSLNKEEAKSLRDGLESWIDNNSFHMRHMIQSRIAFLVSQMNFQLKNWKAAFYMQLKNDYHRSEISTNGKDLDVLLFDENIIPTQNQGAWNRALDWDSLEMGIIRKTHQTTEWKSEIAEKMMSDWLIQIQYPLSTDFRHALKKMIVGELYE